MVFRRDRRGGRDLGDEGLLEVFARERGQEHVLTFLRRFSAGQLVEGGQRGHVRFAVRDEVGRLGRLGDHAGWRSLVALLLARARAVGLLLRRGNRRLRGYILFSLVLGHGEGLLDLRGHLREFLHVVCRHRGRTGFWRALEALILEPAVTTLGTVSFLMDINVH